MKHRFYRVSATVLTALLLSCPLTASGVGFSAGSGTVAPGGTILVPITVTDFSGVTSLQFSLQWNSSVLQFVGTSNYGLSGLTSGNNFDTASSNQGKLAVSWEDPEAVGATVSNGTRIFSVELKAIGSNGSTSQVSFSGTLLSLQVAVNFTIVSFTHQPGTVNVSKPKPTITWSNPTAITYGTALSGTQLNAMASVSGSFSYTPSSGTVLNAGSQTLNVTFTPNDTAAYDNATATATITVNKATPTLSWSNPSDIGYGTALSGTQLNAAANASGSSVSGTYAYSPQSGTVLNIGNNQTLSVTFTPTDTANYNSATSSAVINVVKGSQTISFGALSNKNYGDNAFSVSATASSGLPVSFSIVSGSAYASISGNAVTITGVGNVTVRASQSGDANYNEAANVDQTFAIGKGSQTISFAALGNKFFGDGPFTVSATASSGLSVSFSIVSGSAYATLSGNTVTITGTGTVTIRASQGGDNNYNAAPTVDQTFTVSKANQTISFGALSNRAFGDQPFGVSATASSGLAVSYSIVSGLATILGNTVSLTGLGTVTVRASQEGNANYNAATPVDKTFTVGKGNQTISFGALGIKYFGGASFNVNATASSGLPVSFSIVSGSAYASISGNAVTITGVGNVTVRASQSGDANYNEAANVDQTFAIGKGSQTISFAALGNKFFGDGPFTVSATA
ncbi:MAG: hypothetical protein FJ403_22495, partial [Verrucomicrobia bacterium]|nr:hypothetical protein [Verrucomicrobiota bacterium]